ncbi:hypothetical protein BsWGS_25619 [Bradybaena similaris]
MQEMSTPKRTYDDVDPDYTDVCEQQKKRQRVIEQDAKQNACKRIQAIVRNEFQKEISNKEMELHLVDKRLNEARLLMDKLRACIVSTYYRQINQCGTSETSSTNGLTSSIHPAVKKCLGKRPSHHESTSDTSTSHTQKSTGVEISSNSDYTFSSHHKNQSIAEQYNNTSQVTTPNQSSSSAASSSYALTKIPAMPSFDASYDDRRAIFKIKKTVIVGNVSRYIPVDMREANDKSSHRWMVYVRGPNSEKDISGFVKKVSFLLHHSYRPNDLVEIRSPPFQLTRRGWGEFPVRVQLHFVDPRNKKVDILHHLKLDKSYTGQQTLGAETTVEVDLERDFFEADVNNSNHRKQSSQCSSSSSSSSSLYHQADTSFNSLCRAASVHAERPLSVLYMGSSALLEQSDKNLHDNGMSCESEMDEKYSPSQCQNVGGSIGAVGTHVTDSEPACKIKTETLSPENSQDFLEEYNVTIAHDIYDNDDHRPEEEVMVTDVATTVKLELDTGPDTSTVVSEPQTSTSASFSQMKQEYPSVKHGMQTPVTVISMPQWEKSTDTPDQSRPVTLQLSAFNTSNSQTSTPVNPINHQVVGSVSDSLSIDSVDHSLTVPPASSQSSSYVLVESSAPVIKHLGPPASPLISSISILPVLNPAKIIAPPLTVTAQLSSSQNTTTSATSSNAKPAVGQSAVSLVHLTNQQPKLPQLSHQSSDAQKVLIVKPKLPDVKPQIAGPSSLAAAGNISLLQPKPSGPKQVSLLTGRVFTPPTPPPVASKVFTPNHRTKESLLGKHSLVTQSACNQILASRSLLNQTAKSGSKPGQVLILKTVNHPALSVSQTTDHGVSQLHSSANIKLVNSLLGQDVTSRVINRSLLTPSALTEKPGLSLAALNNCISTNNISQTAQPRQKQIIGSDIVLHMPGTPQSQLPNGHSASSFPKMSAIGITKHGKNSSYVPVMSTNIRATTDEERKKNQYEVLMAWKRNRHLQEKAKTAIKVAKDRIEGEADVIPELNLDDYCSMRALIKAAVRLHPLVQAGVNKLTHPYCAESLEQWNTWTVGKQLGSEWHRACFVLKYLKALLGTCSSFREESLMSTRQLVRWCRLHAFSPAITVLKVKPERTDDSFPDDPSSFRNQAHVPSFTAASTLESQLLARAAVQALDDGGSQEVDVVGAEDIDNDKTKPCVNQIQESSDVKTNLECLPPSEGATFVYDELRKRSIKLQPVELEHNVLAHTAAEMLYVAMQEFIGDVLREAAAISSSRSPHSSAVEITKGDVHQALIQLPEAAFTSNQYLGKGDDVSEGSNR